MKLVVAAVLMVPVIAAADPEHFVTIDRQDDSSRVGAELSYQFLPKGSDGTAMRFDVHGQFVDPMSGLGGYVSVPFGYVSGGGQSDEALGDIEAGAIFAVRTANPNSKIILHGGLTLPTEKSSAISQEVGLVTFASRLSDFYQIIPEGTSLRLGVSPMTRSGQLFVRADFGVDLNLSDSQSQTAATLLRFQFGAGLDLGQAALMVESTNVYATGKNGASGGWINTAALSARLDAGTVYPYGALVLALDDDAKGVMDAALTVGLEGKIR
jgi:hypothetical protein